MPSPSSRILATALNLGMALAAAFWLILVVVDTDDSDRAIAPALHNDLLHATAVVFVSCLLVRLHLADASCARTKAMDFQQAVAGHAGAASIGTETTRDLLRPAPRTRGVATVVRSTAIDPEVIDLTERLGRRIRGADADDAS